MKTHRVLWSPVVLSLFLAMMGGMVGGIGSAFAATTTTLTVAVSGSISGPAESVSLSGNVTVTSTVDAASGTVVLALDLTGLSGKGQSTGATYLFTPQAEVVRPLVVADTVVIGVAFYPNSPGGFLSASSALATLKLSFSTATGKLTAVAAAVSTS
ncbi:MAG TPA: hypothetical protein VEL80_06810 [Burkholderiales bacterium]|nr:hypothetical protein [Burkholderiales bacterium]